MQRRSPSNFSPFASRVYRVTRAFLRGRMRRIWLLEKAGLGRRPLFAARRGVVDCLSRFVFTRHDSADPDNKLPRSGCIKPERKGETGEATVRRVEWESVNVVNRNKRGATRSFRLRKHKREEYAGSFINEVTVW